MRSTHIIMAFQLASGGLLFVLCTILLASVLALDPATGRCVALIERAPL